MTERDAWIVLATADLLGAAGFASLVRRYGSATAVLETARRRGTAVVSDPPPDPDPGARDQLRAAGLGEAIVRRAEDAAELRVAVERPATAIVTVLDDGYPSRLRTIDAAPPVLFVRGDPEALDRPQAIAVVGTRHPSDEGIRLASRVAGAIARAGATVVSGLADGIDSAAHRAALTDGGVTVGVLGSGHDRVTPWERRRMIEAIARSGGAVVSQYRPDAPANPTTFPIRNRTISGLSDATVVIEAPVRSGALITARAALAQGRGCFVVPGPIGRATTAGNLALLRAHPGLVRVVAGAVELVDDLGLARSRQVTLAASGVHLSELEVGVAGAIAEGVGDPDRLAATFDLPPATILGIVTRLELAGLVREAFGRYIPCGPLATRGADAVRPGRTRPFARSSGPVLP